MEYVNFQRALDEYGQIIVRRAQLELGTTKTKTRYSVKWGKSGSGWQPRQVTKKKYKGNSNASGALSASLEAKIYQRGKMPSVKIEGLDYGEVVNNGRGPLGGTGTIKGVPPQHLPQWMKVKPVKTRDMETGKFVKATDKNIKTASFLMNRKIKYIGIEPTHFIDLAMDWTRENHFQDLEEALAKDIENNLPDKI